MLGNSQSNWLRNTSGNLKLNCNYFHRNIGIDRNTYSPCQFIRYYCVIGTYKQILIVLFKTQSRSPYMVNTC